MIEHPQFLIGSLQVELIVMVVECIEKKSIKCTQYWPEPTQTGSYGSVEVSCVAQTVFVSYKSCVYPSLLGERY